MPVRDSVARRLRCDSVARRLDRDSVARFVTIALAAVCALAALLPATAARAGTRAGATGLEQVVGPIDATVAAQLPSDPRLWGPYRAARTPNPCIRGSISCVDATIAAMTRGFNALAPSCDHDAVFSLLYLRVTEQYRVDAATPGFFLNPVAVNREDTVFAQLYGSAFLKWRGDAALSVPPAWRLAFAAADARQVSGTGDALLGMVAHIRRDLPFALWRIGMGFKADHEAINTMLKQAYPRIPPELARRFDPTIDPAGLYVPGTDELVVDAIATWRDDAWQDAADLTAAQTTAQWNAVAQRVERKSFDTGLQIYLATRYPVQSATAVRDAYCATHWNSQ